MELETRRTYKRFSVHVIAIIIVKLGENVFTLHDKKLSIVNDSGFCKEPSASHKGNGRNNLMQLSKQQFPRPDWLVLGLIYKAK